MLVKFNISIFLLFYSVMTVAAIDYSDIELKNSSIIYSQALKIKSFNIKQRNSKSYARVHQICSSPFKLTKLQYAFAAFTQVIIGVEQILSSDINDFLVNFDHEFYVSAQLANDLSDPSFYLALEDCQYGPARTSFLVAELFLMDVLGKFIAGLGLFKMMTYIGLKISAIKEIYPHSFNTLALSSALFGFYHLLQKKDNINEIPDGENVIVIDSAADLDKLINLEISKINVVAIQQDLLLDLSTRIEALENKQNDPSISTDKYSKIEALLNELRIKYLAAEAVNL